MDTDLIITIVAGLLIAVGVAGIVVPVLPGSILILLAFLGWAIGVSSGAGWWSFAFGALFALSGLSASAVLTGRKLKQRQIPNRSVLIGLAAGIAGMFFHSGCWADRRLRRRAPAQRVRAAAQSSRLRRPRPGRR